MKVVNNIDKKELVDALRVMTVNTDGDAVNIGSLKAGDKIMVLPKGVKKVVVK